MRKILIKFLSSILVMLIALLIININFKGVVSNLFFQNMKDVFGNTDTSDIINSNPQAMEIFDEYMDTIIDEAKDNNIDISVMDDYDLEGKTRDFISNNRENLSKYGINIDDQKIDEFASKIKNNYMDDFTKNIVGMDNDDSSNIVKYLKIYRIVTATSFKDLLVLGIIVDSLLIIIISFSLYKWIKYISTSLITGGLIPIIISYISNKIVTSYMDFDISFKSIYKMSSIVVVFGIVLLIVYYIINGIVRRNENDLS